MSSGTAIARRWVAIAAWICLLAVAAGAFGAHALKARLDAQQMATFQTAVQYQFIHGAAILACAALRPWMASRALAVAVCSFLIGTLLFCGSLYALVWTGIRTLGIVTPIGGVAFLAGWLALFVASIGCRGAGR